jgi:endonuclease G
MTNGIARSHGYRTDFLGVEVPFPTFTPELDQKVLRKQILTDEIYADYINYTIVMNADLRTPVFAALNIDQQKLKNVSQRGWRIDSRIGSENQLNNDYYAANPWDRGHLARRASAAWGDSLREAKQASDDTFFFSNASLQHENFNQDEWSALEDWVKDLSIDGTDKISVFSGPFFEPFVRSITPQGRTTALIPSGFFKVVAFINKSNELDARAFIMRQDADTLLDKRGRRMFEFQRYQVSIMEIEELTGLLFPG